MNINEVFAHVDELFETKQSHQVEPFLLACLEQAEAENDLGAVISLCSELGGFYRALGRYDEGVPLYEKALLAIKTLDIENTEHHATTLVNYGTTYAVKGEPEKALQIFGQAAGIFDNLGLTRDYRVATLHNNMSILCQDTGDTEQALAHLKQALAILEWLDESDIEIATTYTNMAQVYLQADQPEKALEAAQESLRMFNAAGAASDGASGGSPSSADFTASDGAAEAAQGQAPSSAEQDVHYGGALETMGHILLRLGRRAEALTYLNKAIALTERDYGRDSLAYKALEELIEKEAQHETP